MIADRLGMVSWRNDSHPTDVVKPVYGIPTFPLTTKLCNQKDTKWQIHQIQMAMRVAHR